MEAFEQLHAVIGDTLDTGDMRGFEEDEDVSTEFVAYEDCEMCGGEGERWLESDCDEIPSPGWVPCDVCFKRRIADLEAQTDTAQTAIDALLKRCSMAERQRDDLAAALIAIRDEFDLGCEKWCAANGLRPTAEFQVDGMARFVAQEALARLKGDERE